MPLGYSTVRVNVGALIIDGVDEDDQFDDVPVTGNMVLTPMLDPAKPVQVDDGGVMKIKAIAPFEVEIGLTGQISHRNRDYVTVPAPTSLTSNLSMLQWRASFNGLKYGSKSITVPPIYFWAEPGLQINLADHINVGPNSTALQLSRGPRGFGVGDVAVDGSELVFLSEAAGNPEISRVTLPPQETVVGADSITEAELADTAVTGPKIAQDAVTASKLANGAVARAKLAEAVLVELDGKAATSAVSAALASKADTSALAAKLDKTEAAASYAPVSLADDVAEKVTEPAGGTDGQVLARSGASVVWATPSAAAAAQVAPTMAGLIRALKAGQSAALTGFGDSTGDSDGSVPADDRTISRFVRRLAGAFPTHHVLMKTLNAAGTGFGPWVVMQNHASGRRYANITTRSLRYVPPVLADSQFASGTLDIRALVALSTLTPGASQALVGRTRKEVAGTLSNDLQFELFINAAGNLVFHHSTDGAAFISDRVSSVPIPATVGVPIWLRATYEHTFGAVFSVNFYTSEDGVTWTKLGATITGGNTTTPVIWPASAGSFFEAGARAWQPAAVPFTGGKIYEVQIRDGLAGPMIAPGALEVWERYGDAATSFGGAPTLYVLNCSRSGSAMVYHKDPARLKIETADYGQQALLFNDGHNETTFTGSKWIPPYEEWVTAVKGRLPNAAVNVIGQNPHTSAWVNEASYGIEHVKRIMELSAAAGRLGWGFVNIFQAYLDDPRGVAALLSADGLHPVADGYVLSGDTVAKTAGIV